MYIVPLMLPCDPVAVKSAFMSPAFLTAEEVLSRTVFAFGLCAIAHIDIINASAEENKNFVIFMFGILVLNVLFDSIL